MAGKSTPLRQHLQALPSEQRDVTMSFGQIEQIINDKLPISASQYRPWWSNEAKGSHVQARAWLDARWKVDTVNFNQKWVRFIRT